MLLVKAAATACYDWCAFSRPPWRRWHNTTTPPTMMMVGDPGKVIVGGDFSPSSWRRPHRCLWLELFSRHMFVDSENGGIVVLCYVAALLCAVSSIFAWLISICFRFLGGHLGWSQGEDCVSVLKQKSFLMNCKWWSCVLRNWNKFVENLVEMV